MERIEEHPMEDTGPGPGARLSDHLGEPDLPAQCHLFQQHFFGDPGIQADHDQEQESRHAKSWQYVLPEFL